MKITGGLAKGIHLITPKTSSVRPATDYIRQAVFSSLANLVHDAIFLDLFAGTGAYGLEAWSRDAQSGIFIEKDRHCIPCIQKNLDAVSKSAQKNPSLCKIILAEALKTDIPKNHFDLIFADPPYEITPSILPELLNLASSSLKKSENSRLILELPGHIIPPQHPNLSIIKKLGKEKSNSPSILIWKPEFGIRKNEE